MATDTSNTFCQQNSGIDKYSGSFDKVDGGCTIVVNQTINSITNIDALGLFAYLACRPSNWRLNAKNLAVHFDCNKDKIYKCIDILLEARLLQRFEVREKGRFVRYHYRIHITPHDAPDSPRLEKPDTVKPDTENPDAYKTKKLKNKEKEKTTTTCGSSSFTPFEKKALALKLPSDNRTDAEFLENLHHHIENNSDSTKSEYQRQQMLLKLLKQLKAANHAFQSTGFISEETRKIIERERQIREIIARYNEFVSKLKADMFIKLLPSDTIIPTFEDWKAQECIE